MKNIFLLLLIFVSFASTAQSQLPSKEVTVEDIGYGFGIIEIPDYSPVSFHIDHDSASLSSFEFPLSYYLWNLVCPDGRTITLSVDIPTSVTFVGEIDGEIYLAGSGYIKDRTRLVWQTVIYRWVSSSVAGLIIIDKLYTPEGLPCIGLESLNYNEVSMVFDNYPKTDTLLIPRDSGLRIEMTSIVKELQELHCPWGIASFEVKGSTPDSVWGMSLCIGCMSTAEQMVESWIFGDGEEMLLTDLKTGDTTSVNPFVHFYANEILQDLLWECLLDNTTGISGLVVDSVAKGVRSIVMGLGGFYQGLEIGEGSYLVTVPIIYNETYRVRSVHGLNGNTVYLFLGTWQSPNVCIVGVNLPEADSVFLVAKVSVKKYHRVTGSFAISGDVLEIEVTDLYSRTFFVKYKKQDDGVWVLE